MLFPIAQLIEGREPPMCIEQSLHVKDAMNIMLKNDFGQLPVVDGEGRYIGMVSQTVVANTYFLLGGQVPVLELSLDNCMARVDPLTLEDDLFEACDRIRGGEYAVVVVDERKPVGIITANDLTEFFRKRSEDFIKIEDIEVTLRLRTRDAFPDDTSMNGAIMNALGPNPDDPQLARKDFTDLSLGELVQVMTQNDNWPHFNGMFAPLGLFNSHMSNIRQVRNQLAHFRGHADPVQNVSLKYARDWLSMRANAARHINSQARQIVVGKDQVPASGSVTDPWLKLREWLSQQEKSADGIRVSFRDLDLVTGGKMPKAARKYASWWSNTNPENPQCSAWLDSGWKVAHANFFTQDVIFVPIDGPVSGDAQVGSENRANNNGHKASEGVAGAPAQRER
jgi:CBS domain-containing protein